MYILRITKNTDHHEFKFQIRVNIYKIEVTKHTTEESHTYSKLSNSQYVLSEFV